MTAPTAVLTPASTPAPTPVSNSSPCVSDSDFNFRLQNGADTFHGYFVSEYLPASTPPARRWAARAAGFSCVGSVCAKQ
eukprot:5460423-Pyramimonas_sp.AAC.1